MNTPFFSAIALLVGTVVGAGIFALPGGFSRAGVVVGLLLTAVVAWFSYLLHSAYGEVVLRTRRVKQLPGLAEKYLGKAGRWVALCTALFGGYGAMLAYLIGIGTFLELLFGNLFGGTAFGYGTLFFLIASIAVLFGLHVVTVAQRYMFVLLLVVLVLFLLFGLPSFELPTLLSVEPTFGGAMALYGMLLFAFVGTSALVDMERVLARDKGRMRPAILVAFIVISFVYIAFSLLVVGVSGGATSPQAIEGLVPFLGSGILAIGAVFGTLAMASSFLISGLVIREIFEFDFKMPKVGAWALAVAPPFLIFLLGVTDFSLVVEVVGSIVVGLTIILILAMHAKSKEKGDETPAYSLTLPAWLRWMMYGVFGAGIVYQIVSLLIPSLA